MAFKKTQKQHATRTMKSTEQPTRRLEDLGIGHGAGDGQWTTVESWFETDDAEFSVPFMLVESFEYNDDAKRPKYGFGLVMEYDGSGDPEEEDHTKYYIAFPATNKKGESHKEREKLFKLLQDDSTPITGCVMQRVDTGQDNPFVKIISVEQMERIIEAESDDDEDD